MGTWVTDDGEGKRRSLRRRRQRRRDLQGSGNGSALGCAMSKKADCWTVMRVKKCLGKWARRAHTRKVHIWRHDIPLTILHRLNTVLIYHFAISSGSWIVLCHQPVAFDCSISTSAVFPERRYGSFIHRLVDCADPICLSSSASRAIPQHHALSPLSCLSRYPLTLLNANSG
jgi:hypothetical protein